MSNSTRSIIFTISFLITMSIFSFVMPIFDYFFSNYIIFINSIISLIILFFPTIEMLCRFIYTKKYLSNEKILFSLKIKQNMAYYRLLNLMFIFLVIFLPLYKKIYESNPLNLVVITFAWILISEILLYISSKSIKAHFTNNSIIISGIDLRIDIPLSDTIKTHSGNYSYFDFSNFKTEKNILILNLENQSGKLFIEIPENLREPILHYLASKNIKKIL